MHEQDGELMKRLKDHREDNLEVFKIGEDDRKKVDKYKSERTDSE
jgi:hypothetical protein